MLEQIDQIIKVIDEAVWGLPLIILILFTGFLLTTRLGLLQIRHLGKALKFMFQNEEDGHGEVTSFGALCTALSATIGTGNITGVATALAAGGPGSAVLDGYRGVFRNGDKICGRPFGDQISHDR